MTVRIINADVMDGLRTLADESVHCVVTSPPYWGLRDYGVAGQIGLEPTFQEFITRLVGVFAEVRRVLRSDGVCFVNMGDAYANDTKWGGSTSGKHVSALHGESGIGRAKKATGLKPKDLIGQPWRLAFALQDAGWWLRGDYIWSKPNPMPESVTDRCTKAHEYVFHLTKSAKYFWDNEAIKESAVASRATDMDGGPQRNRDGSNANDGRNFGRASGNKSHKSASEYERSDSDEHRTKAGLLKISDVAFAERNKRSVWTIATAPFPEAHFATFPPALAEICIKAGCPKGGTVLDPFSGAGTTAMVADRLQRNAIGIELNPEYAAMSRRRIEKDAPLFAEVTA